jgi:hypothetical protein
MRGSLSEFTLNHLLQLFGVAERTGSVTIESAGCRVELLVEVNRVTGLGLDGFDPRESLLACELLPSSSRATLLAVTPRPDTPGLSMLARNAVEPERWEAFVQRLLEQHVYPLLNCEHGAFEVTIGRCPPPALRMSVSIQQIILDATRWEAETEALHDEGYRSDSRWERSAAHAAATNMGQFSGTQWLIWAIATEPTSIGEASRRLCLPELATTSAVKRLHGLGVLEPVTS